MAIRQATLRRLMARGASAIRSLPRARADFGYSVEWRARAAVRLAGRSDPRSVW